MSALIRRLTDVFIEVIGHQSLPDDVDRDDVEDLIVAALGPDGEVTGAGSGTGGWNLDVELFADAAEGGHLVRRLASVLVGHDLGWVLLRPEDDEIGQAARDLA